MCSARGPSQTSTRACTARSDGFRSVTECDADAFNRVAAERAANWVAKQLEKQPHSGAFKLSRSFFAEFVEAPLSNAVDAAGMTALRARLEDAGKCPPGEFQAHAVELCMAEVEEALPSADDADAVAAWREVYQQRAVRAKSLLAPRPAKTAATLRATRAARGQLCAQACQGVATLVLMECCTQAAPCAQAQQPGGPVARRKSGPIRGDDRKFAKVKAVEVKGSHAAEEARRRIGGEYEYLRVFVAGPVDNWQHVWVTSSEGLQVRRRQSVFVCRLPHLSPSVPFAAPRNGLCHG